jgi:poly-gamma-glutamate capsule biosynthesis protein CapA/YwtB (metallophosphatase superfamily)
MVVRRFSTPPPFTGKAETKLVLSEESDNDLSIGFVGDICPLRNREAVFSDDLIEFFSECSLMVGNFEGVITKESYRPFRLKHTPEIFEVLKTIKPLQHWALSIANNHAVDYNEVALDRTLFEFDKRGINWFGTKEEPTATISRGITATAWTWWMNGRTDRISNRDPGVPQEGGLHMAIPHWGYEHERHPRLSQRKKVPEGYDIVVGHHSHLPQPLERLDNAVPVAWSLGNFLTAKSLPVLGEGAVMKVIINRPDGMTPKIQSVEYRAIILDRDDPDYCRVSFR